MVWVVQELLIISPALPSARAVATNVSYCFEGRLKV